MEAFISGVGRAWEGTTPEEYEVEVRAFLASHRDERFCRPFTELVYRPMLELFDLMRALPLIYFLTLLFLKANPGTRSAAQDLS